MADRDPIRICQVCAVEFTYRTFLSPLAEVLSGNGYQLHAAFTADAPGLQQLGSVRIHPVVIARSPSPLALVRSTVGLWHLFRTEHFTLVHVHTPVAAIAARLAACLARTPIVLYTAHGFYFHDGMVWPLRWAHIALEWLLAPLATELLTVSAEDATLARRLRFKAASRIHAIGNGVDTQRFVPAEVSDRLRCRERFGLHSEAVVIGIVARQVSEKGYLELFAAFEQLAAADLRVQLLICGSRLPSDHAGSIEAPLSALQQAWPARVVDAGQLVDVEAAYQAMDVFCLPSWREGLPCTVIEALCCGLPVVATAIRGCRELVVPDLTGVLVPPRDSTALAAALRRLIADASLRQQVGQAGRVRALARYDQRQVLAHQVRLYQAALARARIA